MNEIIMIRDFFTSDVVLPLMEVINISKRKIKLSKVIQLTSHFLYGITLPKHISPIRKKIINKNK